MDFVAGVSHELRTPLSVIVSAGDNLAEGVIRSDNQVREYGALIRDEGRRLAHMVEQTLQFSARQVGRRYDLRAWAVEELLNQAVVEARPLLDARGFAVETACAPALPAVSADRPALVQALHNLITNAVKYSVDARWIGIRAESGTGPRGPEVRIAIADRGPGIDASDLPHLFDPFYRGADAKERQIEGSGLGLSLTRETIQAMGGRITVESRAGQGSIFTIHLPAYLPDREQAAPDAVPS
jgi:signal transduction histidine kinase